MTRAAVRTPRLVLLFATPVLTMFACGADPKIDVQVAQAPPPAAQPAMAPAAPGEAVSPHGAAPAGMPAGTPAGAPPAPPIAPDAQMPANHPPISGLSPAPGAGTAPAMARSTTPGTPGALPPGHPPMEGGAPPASMELRPVDPAHGTGAAALAWTAPAGWVSVPPASSMRRAQYRVPGPGGDGECAVFYFGPGEGGDPMSNAQRWADQFVPPGGKPPLEAMKTRTLDSGGVKALLVETAGTYMAGSMTGGAVREMPGFALLGAIVEGPDANWFFKLTGPEATVVAQRAAFEQMIGSMQRGQ